MKAGSIIKRSLSGLQGFIWNHMGIYMGNSQVIHFNGESKTISDATIKLDSLAHFADGKSVYIHAEPVSRRHAVAVCREAEKHLKNIRNGFNNNYDFVFQNCEDFCVQCFEVEY